MEESVQDKINKIKELAKKSNNLSKTTVTKLQVEDNLSKSIRNEKEAVSFMNEIQFIISKNK